jgi:hypothetical protein
MKKRLAFWVTAFFLMFVTQHANAFFKSRFPMGSTGYLREACIVAVKLEDNEWKEGRDSEHKLLACYSIIRGAISFPQLLCSIDGSETVLSNPDYPWLKPLFTVDPDADLGLLIREFVIEADKEPSKWEYPYTAVLAQVFQKFPCKKGE